MNSFVIAVFLACCLITAVIPVYFVFCNKVYKDGVFGRISLLGISFFATLFLFSALDDHDYRMTFITAGFVCNTALFLVWHLFRFHRRGPKPRSDGQLDRRVSNRRFSQ